MTTSRMVHPVAQFIDIPPVPRPAVATRQVTAVEYRWFRRYFARTSGKLNEFSCQVLIQSVAWNKIWSNGAHSH